MFVCALLVNAVLAANRMHGIRIYSRHRFGELFAPLFDPLRGHSWLTLSESFQYPVEWIDESTFDAAGEVCLAGPVKDFEAEVTRICDVTPMTRTTYGYSATTDIFPKFAAAVSEDWSSIFGLAGKVAEPRRWLEDYYNAKDRARYLSEHADAVFLSVDGSFWACFTKSGQFLKLLERHLQSLQVTTDPVQLSDLDYL